MSVVELSELAERVIENASTELPHSRIDEYADLFNSLTTPSDDSILDVIETIRAGGNAFKEKLTHRLTDSSFKIHENPEVLVMQLSGLAVTSIPLIPLRNRIYSELDSSIGLSSLVGHCGTYEEISSPKADDYLLQALGNIEYLKATHPNIPLVAIGHSTGCKVFENLISLYPNLFDAYVAICPPTVLKNPLHQHGLPILKGIHKLSPKLSEKIAEIGKFSTAPRKKTFYLKPLTLLSSMLGNVRLPSEALVQFQLLRQSGNRALGKINIPTLLLTGGRDRLVNARPTINLMEKKIEDLTHIHYPKGKHQLQIGRYQQEVESQILDFIKMIAENFTTKPLS